MKKDTDLSNVEGVPVYVKISDNYYNKVYRTYTTAGNSQFGAADSGISVSGETATFTISPALTPLAGQEYRFQVRTVNVDGVVSSAAELVQQVYV